MDAPDGEKAKAEGTTPELQLEQLKLSEAIDEAVKVRGCVQIFLPWRYFFLSVYLQKKIPSTTMITFAQCQEQPTGAHTGVCGLKARSLGNVRRSVQHLHLCSFILLHTPLEMLIDKREDLLPPCPFFCPSWRCSTAYTFRRSPPPLISRTHWGNATPTPLPRLRFILFFVGWLLWLSNPLSAVFGLVPQVKLAWREQVAFFWDARHSTSFFPSPLAITLGVYHQK